MVGEQANEFLADGAGSAEDSHGVTHGSLILNWD